MYILKQQFPVSTKQHNANPRALTSPFYSSFLELTAVPSVQRPEPSYPKLGPVLAR